MLETIKKIVISSRIAPDYIAEEIDYETTFDELGINEFDKGELFTALEMEYDIEFTDEQVDSIDNFSDLVTVIEDLIRQD